MTTLHPGAWWAWALLLGCAATRTTDPVLLVLLVAVVCFVVAGRPRPAGGRDFGFFARLAVVVLALRLAFEVVFGSPLPGTTIVRLPSVTLPSYLVGLRVGGAVTTQALLTATYGGLQLATLLLCVGAANALASPRRLLRSLPGALYELGVAVTVGLTVAPQLVAATDRMRHARRLRGRPSSGVRGWAAVAIPVLNDGLESAVALAAAMDARGFGRRGDTSPARRRLTTAAVVTGLLATAIAVYGLLDAGSPAALGLPMLVAGSACAAGAVVVGQRGVVRSRYRPQAWTSREWAVVVAGAAALLGVIASGHVAPGSLHTGVYPLAAPALPWPAAVGVVAAAVPGVLR